jgi:hypothetical protein
MKVNKAHTIFLLLISGIIICIAYSCKKTYPKNPYEPFNNGVHDSTFNAKLDSTSFEGLYQQIFKPTCANSGCHDGTFPPEFRTIQGSYNTMVYAGIIKNDTTDPFVYRVKPGDAAHSMLMKRLTIDLYGNSGIMPLVIDSASDWTWDRDNHINNIRSWINNGAKDIFGQAATMADHKPQLNGFQVLIGGSPQTRTPSGSVIIPAGTSSMEVYIAITDAEKTPDQLTYRKIAISNQRDNFDHAQIFDLTLVPAMPMITYDGTTQNYVYKATITNPGTLWPGSNYLGIKVMMDDGVNGISNLPGVDALEHIKNYYSMELH